MAPAGPGPGAYMLPTTIGGAGYHDLRKTRRPMYSFGMRTTIRGQTVGPGPGKYKYDKVTRFGIEYSPAFSITKRNQIKMTTFGPGPGAYGNFSNLPFRNPPAFSFGVRHIDFSMRPDNSPGPKYMINLNAFKPSSPAFSIAGRIHYKTLSQSPGPAYGIPNLDVILRRSPAFSLGGPHITLKISSQIPGANSYNISNWKPGYNSPAFSFGIKHSPNAPPLILPCDN